MKINEKHLKELRDCELYQGMLPRYQKTLEWVVKEYIKLTEEENIETVVYFLTKQKNDSIEIHSPKKIQINQRRLLNLNVLNFDYGIQFLNDRFMPFFGENEIALFNSLTPKDEIENGNICLVKIDSFSGYYLATKEESGFFELDGSYLDSGEKTFVLGTLVNIETR